MSFRLTMPVDRVLNATNQAIRFGLMDAAENILNVSNENVPHEFGDLEGSGHVVSDGDTVAVVYDSPYATPQHERLDYRHNNGRTAKYLENAANSERAASQRLVAEAIRRML